MTEEREWQRIQHGGVNILFPVSATDFIARQWHWADILASGHARNI